MSELIIANLKNKLDSLSTYGEIDVETRRNALKEELQFYVLNFIYHHPEYSKWIMYGGSALRICHGLNRMSVDLDFEISHQVSEKFLNELKDNIEKYFSSTYGTNSSFLSTKINNRRGLLLKFHVGDVLNFGHTSKQVHIKIDLNNFVAPKTVSERMPINRDQLSFVIVTYNMSALMASKIAAIFLRGTRGVGGAIYEEKGRDIYDLLWYMEKKIIPDFDYLVAKNVEVKDPRALFDKLTLKMNKVDNNNLKQDLIYLFENKTFIENWLSNWLESYFKLVKDYEINTVVKLNRIEVQQDNSTDIFYFLFHYDSDDGRDIRIMYAISDYWIEYSEGNLPIKKDIKIEKSITFLNGGWHIGSKQQEKILPYVTLFSVKNEKYFKKMNNVILGDIIRTKTIRMTTDKFDRKEQVVLNKSTLLSCELDDLLK